MKMFVVLVCSHCCIALSLPSVSAKELWGYADKNGKVVIAPQFAYASSFSHGYAECYGYSCKTGEADRDNIIFVDKSGQKSVLSSNNYSRATSKTEIHNIFDIGGKKIIQDNSTVWSTRGNFKLVQGAYGDCVSDLRGHILKKVPQSWSNEGTYPLTGNHWCSVGSKAYEFTGVTKSEVPGFEPTTKPPNLAAGFSYFDGFHEGLAAALTKDGHWVYLDSKGKATIHLPRDCSNAQAFSEGLAAVSVGGNPWKEGNRARINANNGAKFGFIDKTGKFVIPPTFPCPYTQWSNNLDAGSQFREGIAIATAYKDGDVAFGYIDRNGKFVVPPIYRSIGPLSEGMIAINAQPVGFDKDEWMEQRPGNFNQLVYFRAEVFAKFLRQFELVGMQRSKVENLLGKPNGISEHNKVDFYTLSRMLKAEIKYTHEKVSGYRVAYWCDCADKWITSSVKPEPDEDLANFCSKNASR